MGVVGVSNVTEMVTPLPGVRSHFSAAERVRRAELQPSCSASQRKSVIHWSGVFERRGVYHLGCAIFGVPGPAAKVTTT